MLRSRLNSFACALNGIRILVRTQPNARLHLAATIAVVFLAAWFPISPQERLWIALAVLAVWAAEAFNTAIEFVTDLASPEPHPLAGSAKDVAAGAVLITSAAAALVGSAIFAPFVLELLKWH